MGKVFINDLRRMKRCRDEIEKALQVKIDVVEDGVEIEGKDGISEYLAEKVLEAIDLGFTAHQALQLRNEDFMFEKLNIKDYARASRLHTIKGRLIGKKGRAKGVMEELADCSIAIKDYNIGIIGKTADVDSAIHAIKDLIMGLPHAKVYAFLEKSRKLRRQKLEEEESLK